MAEGLARYKAIFESAVDFAIVATDRDGRVTDWNPGAEQILGWSADEMCGQLVDRIFTPEDRDADRPNIEMQRSLEQGRATDERWHLRKDGRRFWANGEMMPLRELDGSHIGFLKIMRDQTVQRQVADARIARLTLQDTLRSVMEPDEMAARAAAAIGTTLKVSAAGYASVDATGNHALVEQDWVSGDMPSLVGTFVLSDFGTFVEELRRGEEVVIEDVRLDPRSAAQAAGFDALSVRSLAKVPLIEEGRLVAYFFVASNEPRQWSPEEVSFVRDIAERTRLAIERRRAEVGLRDLNARLESEVELRTAERDRMWDSSPDLMVVMSPDGVYQRVNPAWQAVLGYEPADLAGVYATDLTHPDDLAATEIALDRAQSGELPVFDNRFRHRDGSYRWLQWVAAPSPDGIFATGRHVTQAKESEARLAEAEGQLRQSQKMEAVGQLTGGLAHDFNNLLTGISGSLEMMAIRIGQGRMGDVEKYNTAAQAAAKRAAALTHRLLAFSRRQTLDPRPTQANRLIEDMLEMIQRTVGPEVEAKFVGADALWTTLVDPHQLENAVLNLCINARDAMPDGGTVTIETSNAIIDERNGRLRELEPGSYVALCVSDSGTGMSPDVIAKAFDPFFTTKPIGVGTGLGLSMIYGFARQSGGQVRIHSIVGEGTTVCIYLPRHLGKAEVDEGVPDLAEAPRAKVGETVLVVDDEPSVRMLVTDVLEELGYTAIEAADGAGGLRVLQSDAHIDLLVSDVGLPGGMNGRQMADAARVSRPDLKILFITGYAENAVVGNGHLDPGMHVMTKPFAMEALATRIRTLIEDS